MNNQIDKSNQIEIGNYVRGLGVDSAVLAAALDRDVQFFYAANLILAVLPC
jgi:hypothetical protein